jgi:hypothetical protein
VKASANRIANHPALRKPTVDVVVENHGDVFLFHPLTANAERWMEENVSSEGYHANWPILVVEHRYAFDLAQGMQQAGLAVR